MASVVSLVIQLQGGCHRGGVHRLADDRDDVVGPFEVLVVGQGHEVVAHDVAVTREQLDHLDLAVLEGGHAERSRFVEGLEAGEVQSVDLDLSPGSHPAKVGHSGGPPRVIFEA